MFASELTTGKIPVIVVFGAPASGKSYFLNQLLSLPVFVHSVVLATSGDTQSHIHFDRVQRLAPLTFAEDAETGCLCCGMRSGLGDALRDLFLRALTKKIPRLERVFIETNLMDPQSVKFTLRHAPFLGQRYAFHSAWLILDLSVPGAQTLDFVGAGIEYADYVVLSKTDCMQPEYIKQVEFAVKQLNPQANLVLFNDKLEALLVNTLHSCSLKV